MSFSQREYCSFFVHSLVDLVHRSGGHVVEVNGDGAATNNLDFILKFSLN